MPLIQVSGHTFFSDNLRASSCVLDLGANRGAFAQEVNSRFASQCVCVEPNPELWRALAGRTGILALNVAVAAAAGSVRLNLSANPEASSFLASSSAGDRITGTVDVEAITLEDCVRQTGWSRCDLVKVDIEGAEIAALSAASDEFLRSIPQFTIEFHDFCGLSSTEEVKRTIARFRRLGFSVMKMWWRAHGDVVFVQRAKVGISLPAFLAAKYLQRNWWRITGTLKRLSSR
jgi:FkbM family methyltransferase